MKEKISLLLLFIYPVCAIANDSMKLESFAEGIELVTNERAAIYRLAIPGEVYQTVSRSDLGDIRVFNNNRERVPHAIRKAKDKLQQPAIISLPYFPLHDAIQEINNSDKLEVIVEENGTIVQIRSRDYGYESRNIGISSYIVDLSDVRKRIDELKIELSVSDGGYIKKLSLQTSNDLNHWTHLLDATITDLQYGNHSLKQNRIELPSFNAKYLRINWNEGADGVQITDIKATLDDVQYKRSRLWSQITGEKDKRKPHIFRFDTGGSYPVDRINIDLQEDNTLIEATLMSRPDEKTKWRHRFRGIFYRLQVNDKIIENGNVNIGNTRDRYWKLEVETDDGLGSENPDLRFGWIANDLYFIARGNAPFILAYGNSNIEGPDKPVDRLMNVLSRNQEQDFIAEAHPGIHKILMGEKALNPGMIINWQKIILWSVLVLGVLILAIMSFRLSKQLNNS